jgi:hypothetical protein
MVPLHSPSQPLFAFTWPDPITHHTQQLTWTVLPQGLRDFLPSFWLSPTAGSQFPRSFPKQAHPVCR